MPASGLRRSQSATHGGHPAPAAARPIPAARAARSVQPRAGPPRAARPRSRSPPAVFALKPSRGCVSSPQTGPTGRSLGRPMMRLGAIVPQYRLLTRGPGSAHLSALPGPGPERGLPAAQLLSAVGLELAGYRQGDLPRPGRHRLALRPRHPLAGLEFQLPSVVALKEYIPQNRRPPFTRFNVFLRDRFACQYCRAAAPAPELTFDHLVPRSRGGRTAWANIVTACTRCNLRKGNRLPQECGMHPSPSRRCRRRTNCGSTAGRSRRTTCTRAGATISTGTSSWIRKPSWVGSHGASHRTMPVPEWRSVLNWP